MRIAKRTVGWLCLGLLGACSHSTMQGPATEVAEAPAQDVAPLMAYDQAPAAEQQAPAAEQQAPATEQQTQGSEQLAAPEPAPAPPAPEVAKLPEPEETVPQQQAITDQSDSGIVVSRFVLSRGIAEREPVDDAESFKPGERIYAFLQVANQHEPFDLSVRWQPAEPAEDAHRPEAVQLNVGTSARWRTWSWTKAPTEPGKYVCVIETADGELVSTREFNVDADAG